MAIDQKPPLPNFGPKNPQPPLDLEKIFNEERIDLKALMDSRKLTKEINKTLAPYTGEFGDAQKKHLLKRTMVGYASWQFYLAGEAEQNAAPFAASAVSPTPGSTASPTDGKVTIEWDASDPDEDTLTYTLEVSTSANFAAASTTSFADLTGKTQAVDVTAGVYYWRVTVADESISVTSDVFSFRVE